MAEENKTLEWFKRNLGSVEGVTNIGLNVASGGIYELAKDFHMKGGNSDVPYEEDIHPENWPDDITIPELSIMPGAIYPDPEKIASIKKENETPKAYEHWLSIYEEDIKNRGLTPKQLREKGFKTDLFKKLVKRGFSPEDAADKADEIYEQAYGDSELDRSGDPFDIDNEDINGDESSDVNGDENGNVNGDEGIDLDSKEGIMSFLQDLLGNEEQAPVADLPMEMDLEQNNELNPIQMLAMKVKTLNPQAGQELWNMSNLPLNQIIELYGFRYDICLASPNINEGRNNYGLGIQAYTNNKGFRKTIRKKKRSKKGFQGRYG